MENVNLGLGALPAPFPWFGGKRLVAPEVWARFGSVANYVEPFFGSGAVLLGRPQFSGIETINDLDGFIANFWRAAASQPDCVAEWADNPVNENDLHARHMWLVEQRASLRPRLEGDPEWCDPKIAGWWVWGISCWIGSGFCSGLGPWHVDDGGQLAQRPHLGDGGTGVNRKRPHLSTNGMGVNRNRPHLGNSGMGVNRQLPHLSTNGMGGRLSPWFRALSARLARVRVCSGDWSRVCGPSVTHGLGMTAVFLDPPYADTADRCSDLYRVDDESVAHAVREWAVEAGARPDMRVALCGYEGEHEMPDSWAVHSWTAHGGYANSGEGENHNRRLERIWFSPACLGGRQGALF